MISGTGVDIVEKERIAKALERFGEKFIKRVLTEKEKKDCENKGDRIGSIAARFAAKEAVFKAVGTGWAKGVGWHDLEVLTGQNGEPIVTVYGKIAQIVGNQTVHLSLSHERHAAIAFVIIENME